MADKRVSEGGARGGEPFAKGFPLASGAGRATLILENADVRTQDPLMPRAEAVAMRNGRILAVGSVKDMAALGDAETRRIDLEGRLCLPGFMDSHFHYYQWAMGLTQLGLDKARDFGHAMRLLQEHAAKTPKGEWILGQGFNESDWPENRIPLRDDLDKAAPDHPVIIWRCDLHLAVANSEALRRGGVTDTTEAPADGAIDHDASGRLTGVLREGSICLVRDHIPLPSLEQLTDIMYRGQASAHAMGFTSLHDVRLAGVEREAALTLRVWQRLREMGKLDLRMWTCLPGEGRKQAQELGLRSGIGDDYLRIGHLKYFFDGGMGARTAWMVDPYDDTGECGLCVHPPEELFQEMCEAHEAGLAVMVHAIGDRASRELVTLYERLLTPERRAMPGAPALRHRIEHAQVIRPEDVARLARLDIPVSMMPANMVLDINMISQCAGTVTGCAYPFRPMLEAGIQVMFSSDCPVCDPSPLVNIQAAVTRQRDDATPEGGWHPELRVSVEQAVRAYTSTPAKAYGQEDVTGSISPGKRADVVVLERNIYEIDPLEINRTKVAMTVFDGRVVYGE